MVDKTQHEVMLEHLRNGVSHLAAHHEAVSALMQDYLEGAYSPSEVDNSQGGSDNGSQPT